MSGGSPNFLVYPPSKVHNHATFLFTLPGGSLGTVAATAGAWLSLRQGQALQSGQLSRPKDPTARLPLGGALTHQDVMVSFSEFSEGLGDLLPCFGLLEVPVHRAVFFLGRRAQEGVSTRRLRKPL